MSKTTPIMAAINILKEKRKKFLDLPQTDIRNNIQLTFFNAIQTLERYLEDEKQTMQECFEAGRNYKHNMKAPDFETFYSQYNLK